MQHSQYPFTSLYRDKVSSRQNSNERTSNNHKNTHLPLKIYPLMNTILLRLQLYNSIFVFVWFCFARQQMIGKDYSEMKIGAKFCSPLIVDVRVAYIRKLDVLSNREPLVTANYSPVLYSYLWGGT